MGLQRKQGVPVNEGEQFDIRLTVEDFKSSVNAYTSWKPGMEIHVSHVKRRNIPNFIFPGGIRPSYLSKSTGENKQSSKSRVSGQSQAEKSQGGKTAVLGADDSRKRKRLEDNNNSRISKSSLSPPNREVHEERTLISATSSCSMKYDDSEVNSMGDQKSEQPCLKSAGEIPSGGSVPDVSAMHNKQPDAPDTSNTKEEERLAIEQIMSGPYEAHQALAEEPDELEEDLGYRNQINDNGGSVKSNNFDSPNSKFAVVEEQVISKETVSSTHSFSNGGLEELEVILLFWLKYGIFSLSDSSIKYNATIVNSSY
jgi:poly(A) polymerase